ncbi:MAG: response regulator transcription factor [Chitinophagaceae bacterium]|nr:MAG: response regulator transcription factor [Chitinophagaceae bacterium]
MINCLIVEDEPLAQELLQRYINATDGLHLVATCDNTSAAQTILSAGNTDLVFLDIKMPGMNGMDFLKSLPHPPPVIFTTAYPDYAVESYELLAVDYLLKPVTFQRFTRAMEKFRKENAKEEPGPVKPEWFYIRVGAELVRVKLDELLYVEAKKDYVQVLTRQQSWLTHMTMKAVEESLPAGFIRVHRSFIINAAHVNSWARKSVQIGEKEIPVSESYRKTVEKYSGKL